MKMEEESNEIVIDEIVDESIPPKKIALRDKVRPKQDDPSNDQSEGTEDETTTTVNVPEAAPELKECFFEIDESSLEAVGTSQTEVTDSSMEVESASPEVVDSSMEIDSASPEVAGYHLHIGNVVPDVSEYHAEHDRNTQLEETGYHLGIGRKMSQPPQEVGESLMHLENMMSIGSLQSDRNTQNRSNKERG